MIRRATSLLVTLALPLFAQAADPAKPNVVLIFADDLGYNDVSFNGRKEWQTPHLDKLASQGTTFRRFYTASVVCAPSRAALMTGRYSIHNGVTGNGSYDLPAQEVTIAEALKKHGYATGMFGKWHAGPKRPGTDNWTHPMDQGFDEFFGFTSAKHAWQKFPKELWDGRETKPASGYADNLFATRAIDFIARHKDHPFFLYVPFTAPHSAIEATPEDISEHKGKFKEADPAKPYKATYAALVTRMDKEVGRVMQALDDHKLADHTIVIFTSDHGATFEVLQRGAASSLDSNHPFRGQKRTLWEGGTRVPGVIRWPGRVPAGKESHTPVSTIDVFPTLLAAAGASPDPSLQVDGANLLDHLTGKADAPAGRTLFWEWAESGATYFAAMRGDMKLMVVGGNRPELYDVANDPAERRDISAEHPKLVNELKSQLDAWLATTGDAAKQKRKASDAPGSESARAQSPDINDL